MGMNRHRRMRQKYYLPRIRRDIPNVSNLLMQKDGPLACIAEKHHAGFFLTRTRCPKTKRRRPTRQKENRVRWLYSEESDDEYHKELILDLELQAFYTNSIYRATTFIADYVEIPNYINAESVEDVYASGVAVVVGSNTVQVENTTIANRDSTFSFLTFTETGYFTLGKYTNTNFMDWVVETGGYNYMRLS